MSSSSVTMSIFRLLPEQRFHQAIIDDDIQTLQWLVHNKKIDDICNRGVDENGWSSLMLAARYGRRDIVNYLLELGHDDEVRSADSKGNTVPIISTKYGHEDICLVYLERHPQTMSEVNRDGDSAINWSAQNGLNRVINWILDHGGNVNQRDIEGNTPLHHAASYNQQSTVSLLLEREAQPNVKNYKGYTANEYAYSLAMDKFIKDTAAKIQFKRQHIMQKQAAGAFSASPSLRPSMDMAHAASAVSLSPSKPVTPPTSQFKQHERQ